MRSVNDYIRRDSRVDHVNLQHVGIRLFHSVYRGVKRYVDVEFSRRLRSIADRIRTGAERNYGVYRGSRMYNVSAYRVHKARYVHNSAFVVVKARRYSQRLPLYRKRSAARGLVNPRLFDFVYPHGSGHRYVSVGFDNFYIVIGIIRRQIEFYRALAGSKRLGSDDPASVRYYGNRAERLAVGIVERYAYVYAAGPFTEYRAHYLSVQRVSYP